MNSALKNKTGMLVRLVVFVIALTGLVNQTPATEEESEQETVTTQEAVKEETGLINQTPTSRGDIHDTHAGSMNRTTTEEIVTGVGNPVTINFGDTDIRYVLNTLAKQQKLNVVLSDKVEGSINIRLEDVPFWDAFQIILEMKGLGYEKVGRIIKVATFEELESQRKRKKEAMPEMDVELFYLKYLNAEEVEKVVKGFLSSKGSTTVYYTTIRGGWPVAGISQEGSMGVVRRDKDEREKFPMILIVRDFAENIRKIRELIFALDTLPKQVLVEAMIVEVNYDREKDIGIDWEALGQKGATDSDSFIVGEGRELGAKIEGGTVDAPSAGFTGLTLTYRHLLGAAFKTTIHALEEEGKANVLSSPRMLVLNGHESTILVGSKYPILSTEVTETGAVTSESLDRYEPIGVTLKVVPVVWENSRINLAIHPMVTALGEDVFGSLGTPFKEIITREVDTNITVNSGDTIVIGGLIKTEDKVTHYRVPFLGQIPILGFFFSRKNKTIEKTELLIFLTPSIVEDAVLAEEENIKFKEIQEFLGK